MGHPAAPTHFTEDTEAPTGGHGCVFLVNALWLSAGARSIQPFDRSLASWLCADLECGLHPWPF